MLLPAPPSPPHTAAPHNARPPVWTLQTPRRREHEARGCERLSRRTEHAVLAPPPPRLRHALFQHLVFKHLEPALVERRAVCERVLHVPGSGSKGSGSDLRGWGCVGQGNPAHFAGQDPPRLRSEHGCIGRRDARCAELFPRTVDVEIWSGMRD
eukprot:502298-Rhodomonas_salina.2